MDINSKTLEWNTDTMRQSVDKWTLADDVALLKYLENISKSILGKAHCTLKSIGNFEASLCELFVDVRTASNRFQALADTQFVENRVYEEEDALDVNTSENVLVEVKEEVVNNGVSDAIISCLHTLDSKFETVELSGSDSEDDGFVNRLVLKPMDGYKDRPLPHLIGTEEFMTDDTLGLFPPSSNDSENEEESGESISSDRSSSKSLKDDERSEHDLSAKLMIMQESSSSNSYVEGETDDRGSHFEPEKKSEANANNSISNSSPRSKFTVLLTEKAISNLRPDHNKSQNTLFESDSDESTAATSKKEKVFHVGNKLFNTPTDFLEGKSETSDQGINKVVASDSGTQTPTKKKVPKYGVSIFGEDVDLFGQSPPSLSSSRYNEKESSANKTGNHSAKQNLNGIEIRRDEKSTIFEEKSLFDAELESELFSAEKVKEDPSVTTTENNDKHDEVVHNNRASNMQSTLTDEIGRSYLFAEKEEPFLKDDLFSTNDNDLFSNVHLPVVSDSGLSLFSEEEDDLFSFKDCEDTEKISFSGLAKPSALQDTFNNENLKETENKNVFQSRNNENMIENHNYNLFQDYEEENLSVCDDYSFKKDSGSSEHNMPVVNDIVSSQNNTNDISGKSGESGNFEFYETENESPTIVPKPKQVSNMNDKGTKTEPIRTLKVMENDYDCPRMDSPSQILQGHSTTEDHNFNQSNCRIISEFTINKLPSRSDENHSEDVLPPLMKATLDSLLKDRAKIKAKRRPPSRKSRIKSSQSNEVQSSHPSAILSPSTDEEDLFFVPSLQIQKEKSSSNLFLGSVLLSPGTSFDSEENNAISVKGEKGGDKILTQSLDSKTNIGKNNLFSDLFDHESVEHFEVKQNPNIGTADSLTDIFTQKNDVFKSKNDNLNQESLNKRLFDSDEEGDIFSEPSSSNINVSVVPEFLLGKNSDTNKRSDGFSKSRISCASKQQSKYLLKKSDFGSLFQDSSDEDNFFPNLGKALPIENDGHSQKYEQNPSMFSRKVHELEKKEVFMDPLMALQESGSKTDS